MTARQFRHAFLSAATTLPAFTDRDSWTKEIKRLLNGLGWENCFVKDSDSPSGEVKEYDFAVFSADEAHLRRVKVRDNVTGEMKERIFKYKLLTVVEIENNNTFRGQIKDFYKLCRLVAPLRVFIGYGTSDARRCKIAQQHMDFYDRTEQVNAPSGETHLVMGTQSYGQPCTWRSWLRTNERPWESVDEPI